MRNITVSVDDETYRRARIKAAERDTSVSALVRDFLNSIGGEETAQQRFERLRKLEQAARTRVPAGFAAADRLPRDQLYDRKP